MLAFRNCTHHLSKSVRAFSNGPVSYKVKKGTIAALRGSRIYVEMSEGNKKSVDAYLHPSASSDGISEGTQVFVSMPKASNQTVADYEVIAVGKANPEDKIVFTKYACIHPERPISDLGKLCKNCPRRSRP